MTAYNEFDDGDWRHNLVVLTSFYVDENTMDEAGDMMTGDPTMYPLFDWTLAEALAAVLRGDETVIDSIQGHTRAGDLRGAESIIRRLKAAYEAHK